MITLAHHFAAVLNPSRRSRPCPSRRNTADGAISTILAPRTLSPTPTIRPSTIASLRSAEYRIVPSSASNGVATSGGLPRAEGGVDRIMDGGAEANGREGKASCGSRIGSTVGPASATRGGGAGAAGRLCTTRVGGGGDADRVSSVRVGGAGAAGFVSGARGAGSGAGLFSVTRGGVVGADFASRRGSGVRAVDVAPGRLSGAVVATGAP